MEEKLFCVYRMPKQKHIGIFCPLICFVSACSPAHAITQSKSYKHFQNEYYIYKRAVARIADPLEGVIHLK